jgi:hypothetical protein
MDEDDIEIDFDRLRRQVFLHMLDVENEMAFVRPRKSDSLYDLSPTDVEFLASIGLCDGIQGNKKDPREPKSDSESESESESESDEDEGISPEEAKRFASFYSSLRDGIQDAHRYGHDFELWKKNRVKDREDSRRQSFSGEKDKE